AIVPPPALQPHAPAGTLNFSSAATPVNGRRNNQGLEGVALSPSGTRLFALLQSAPIQDANPAANDQLSKNTRLLIYDVSGTPTPGAPEAEYALVLPTLRSNGNGSAVNNTAAQSEVVALDNTRFLVLSRDGNGLGKDNNNQSVFKSILLVDTSVGAPTNFVNDAARNAEGGKITTAPGVLDPTITPLTWVEAVNLLNSTQLTKFNVRLDTGGQVSKLTLSEKWEGMALVPALDPAAPHDYFLFVGNDNDFLTSAGRMRGPNGVIIGYDGFNGYSSSLRVPPALDSLNHENDTVILAFRLTIDSADPDGQMFGAGRDDDQHFLFRVRQNHDQDYGRLEYWIDGPHHGWGGDECRGDDDHDYGHDHGGSLAHFEASSIDSVVFSDDPAFTSGWGPRPTVDTAKFSGTGKWNGQPGYAFEAIASDRGEPGRHRDTFSLVKDPAGHVVASVSGPIDDGNIQSARLGREH
ncbi:MAG: esterase-like activity of phytase family protein, partial [Vicinamibacterales bacterium]